MGDLNINLSKLEDDLKREIQGIRAEVSSSKNEVIKDATNKQEKVIELSNSVKWLDAKVQEGFTALKQRLLEYATVTDVTALNQKLGGLASLKALQEFESRVKPLIEGTELLLEEYRVDNY